MLSQYGQEKFDHYNDELSSSPLELCSYCKSSLSLSMDALCSSAAVTTLAMASRSSATATTLAEEASLEVSDLQHVSNDASGNNHNGITTTSIACADTDGILDFAMCSEQHYKDNKNSLRILAVMCRGVKTVDGCEILDFNKDPWTSLKVSTYRPSLLEWRSEVRRRAKINVHTMKAKTVSKKDNPMPSQWTIQKCQSWLDTHPISDRSDLTFLRAKILARLDIVTKAVEQKKSKEQKLLTSNDGNNWYDNDPILCLIHTLDKMEIRRSYMN